MFGQGGGQDTLHSRNAHLFGRCRIGTGQWEDAEYGLVVEKLAPGVHVGQNLLIEVIAKVGVDEVVSLEKQALKGAGSRLVQ